MFRNLFNFKQRVNRVLAQGSNPTSRPESRLTIIDFAQHIDHTGWDCWSDEVHLGNSRATFKSNENFSSSDLFLKDNFAIFSGKTDTQIPAAAYKDAEKKMNEKFYRAKKRLVKLGFAAVSREFTPLEKYPIEYDSIEILLRSDGRQYNVNIEPRTFFHDNVYRLSLEVDDKDIGKWTPLRFKLKDMELTAGGRLRNNQRSLFYPAIKSLGFSVQDGKSGDFRLDIKNISLICSRSLEKDELEAIFD